MQVLLAYSIFQQKFLKDQLSCEGLVAVMDGSEVGPFNLGNPMEFTMLELANLVKEVVNPDAEIVYKDNTPDDPSRRKPDISKV